MANQVGWIGLGRMGEAMVKRLLKAGFGASVWNRTRSKAEPLGEIEDDFCGHRRGAVSDLGAVDAGAGECEPDDLRRALEQAIDRR